MLRIRCSIRCRHGRCSLRGWSTIRSRRRREPSRPIGPTKNHSTNARYRRAIRNWPIVAPPCVPPPHVPPLQLRRCDLNPLQPRQPQPTNTTIHRANPPAAARRLQAILRRASRTQTVPDNNRDHSRIDRHPRNATEGVPCSPLRCRERPPWRSVLPAPCSPSPSPLAPRP